MPFSILDQEKPIGFRLAVLVGCLLLCAVYVRTGRRFVRERRAEETTTLGMFWSLFGLSAPLVGRRAVVAGWSWILVGALVLVLGALYCFG